MVEEKRPGVNDLTTGERSPTRGLPKGTVTSSLVWLALIVLYVVFRAISPLAEPALARGSVLAASLGFFAYMLLFAILVLALLTPMTSSSVVILAAVPVLGSWQVFLTALSAAAGRYPRWLSITRSPVRARFMASPPPCSIRSITASR